MGSGTSLVSDYGVRKLCHSTSIVETCCQLFSTTVDARCEKKLASHIVGRTPIEKLAIVVGRTHNLTVRLSTFF